MMLNSDDFGIDEDDTAFLAAATQAEADDRHIELSSRPSKRRRLNADARGEEEEGVFETGKRQATRGQLASTATQAADDEDYYLPGELGESREDEAKRARLLRYKVHKTKNIKQFPNVFLTQTQVGLDEDPAAIRGPIWKKPVAAPSQEAGRELVGMAPPPRQGRALTRTVSTGTLDSFVLRPNHNLHNRRSISQADGKKNIAAPRRISKSANTSFTNEFDEIHSDDFTELAEPMLIDQRSAQEHTARRGPQTGLKQLTIFGQTATQQLSSSEIANKKQSWPAKAREEPATHHELDAVAIETFTYPTNLGDIRDYQFNIVSRSLLHNTLVALPTGLGKTFIAATIMLNYYRWTTSGQIVFMAPTKPLIAQQMEACYGIAGIPRRDTVLMTGETQPVIRAEEWRDRRVFFMTPQTIINDLKSGICDPKRLVLVVVDEAHKATGGYAYTEVVKFLHRFNPSFRVLALTATPGANVDAVQAVIDNLGIARVELRTEESLDIRSYTHHKHTETQLFNYSEEQALIMSHISKAIQPVLNKLNSQNAYWLKDPMSLTPFGCLNARKQWSQSDAGRKAPMAVKGMVNSIFTVLSSLAHSINLLKFHGISIFCASMTSFQRSLTEDRAKRTYDRQIVESADFVKALSYMRGWCNDIDFIGHPKMEYLREVITNHFLDAGEAQHGSTRTARATRVMIFSSFRDSTDEICRVLKRSEPLVRPHVFVGQAASKSSAGMDQKRQSKVIQDFKDGIYNTLVATSIGEEGLDIGDVDLIICYDGSSSPIRMLQRIGRTGRKRAGRVVLLLMRGKEEADYAKAQDSYAYIQKSIADESRYSYRDDQSPRILPMGISPVANKQRVDIPPENSQPIDLNEKARRKKSRIAAKRPPKKFHMPDGVRTGFVRASEMASSGTNNDDSDTDVGPVRRAMTRKSMPKQRVQRLPGVAAMPFLEDVLLTPSQLRDHARRYTRATKDDIDTVIEAPDPSQHTQNFRHAQRIKHVSRSRASTLYRDVLIHMYGLDDLKLDIVRTAERASLDELQHGVKARLFLSSSKNILRDTGLATHRPENHAEVHKAKPAAAQASVLSTNGAQQSRQRGSVTDRRASKRAPRQASAPSDAIEGSESSPEPTPADMRIGTQGIDLGSRDTSGEDEDEEADSELDEFVVNSDQPIEMLTSSVPMEHEFSSSLSRLRQRPRKRLMRKQARPMPPESDTDDADDTECMSVDDGSIGPRFSSADQTHRAGRMKSAQRRQRVVSESESDD